MKKIIVSILASSALLMATEKVVDESYKTHVELGYVTTAGNTQTDTFNLGSSLKKNWNKHAFKFTLDAQYAKSDSLEIKNKYAAELTYDYTITDVFSFNYINGLKQDKFSQYDAQAYTGPGAKYKAIESKIQNLAIEGNILLSIDNYKDDSIEQNEYSALRTKISYDRKIAEALKFEQELGYRTSLNEFDNYFLNSKSVLLNQINSVFSASLSYVIDYVNEAGALKNTDTTFTANLIMDF